MIQAIFDHTAKSPDYMEFKIQVPSSPLRSSPPLSSLPLPGSSPLFRAGSLVFSPLSPHLTSPHLTSLHSPLSP
eukprot:1547646-Rhodomonas_salina.1